MKFFITKQFYKVVKLYESSMGFYFHVMFKSTVNASVIFHLFLDYLEGRGDHF